MKENPMVKTTITASERLQLIGLLTLAASHNQALRDIERAACGLVGVEPDGSGYTGHVSDYVFGSPERGGADGLLARLEITVAPDGQAGTGL
jgi:hypothetical protein